MDLSRLIEALTLNESEFEEGQFWGTSAAGVYIVAKDTGNILLMLRSQEVNEGGTWGIPGGALGIDDAGRMTHPNDTPESALHREMDEEIGFGGKMQLIKSLVFSHKDFRFHNYIGIVEEEFECYLNWESDDYGWFAPDNLPSPLHPGVSWFIGNGGMAQIIDLIEHG